MDRCRSCQTSSSGKSLGAYLLYAESGDGAFSEILVMMTMTTKKSMHVTVAVLRKNNQPANKKFMGSNNSTFRGKSCVFRTCFKC